MLERLPLPALTDKTHTDRAQLASEIAGARAVAFALAEEEYLDGVSGVAVPVMFEERRGGDRRGRPVVAGRQPARADRSAGARVDDGPASHSSARVGSHPNEGGRVDDRADWAGLPRTGTLTQKEALELLGLGPCYHWIDVLADLDGQVALWDGALDGRVRPAEILNGYRPTVDWPGGAFYRELLDSYPDAKVLLSVRDPERWEPSFRETIVDMCHGESLIRLLSSAQARVDPKWHRYLQFVERMFWSEEGTFAAGHSSDVLMEAFVAHNEEVKRIVPAERLLVWGVTDGWEPLCEFLGVPVPTGALPHANDRATFLDRVIGGAITTLGAWQAQQSAER